MTSRTKTTIAKLRDFLEITVFEMAEILGRSKDTVQSLESGRMKLLEEHAQKLFHETGISPAWLLNGNPNKTLVLANGLPYEKGHYERAQAQKRYFDNVPAFQLSMDAIRFYGQLRATLDNANRKDNYYMAAYKLDKALESLRLEYGQELEPYPHTSTVVALMRSDIATVNKYAPRLPDEVKRSSRKKPSSSSAHRRKVRSASKARRHLVSRVRGSARK